MQQNCAAGDARATGSYAAGYVVARPPAPGAAMPEPEPTCPHCGISAKVVHTLGSDEIVWIAQCMCGWRPMEDCPACGAKPATEHDDACPVFLENLRRDVESELNAKLDPEPELRQRISELESGLALALQRGAFDANMRMHLATLLRAKVT